MAKKTTTKSKPEVAAKRAAKPAEKPETAAAPPSKAVPAPVPVKAAPTPAPVKAASTPAPVKTASTPAPVKAAPAPAPVKAAPAPVPAEPKSPKLAIKAKPLVKKATPKKAAPETPAFTRDDVALRAYFISEKRRANGLPGDEHQDWLEAERQIAEESAKKKTKKKA